MNFADSDVSARRLIERLLDDDVALESVQERVRAAFSRVPISGADAYWESIPRHLFEGRPRPTYFSPHRTYEVVAAYAHYLQQQRHSALDRSPERTDSLFSEEHDFVTEQFARDWNELERAAYAVAWNLIRHSARLGASEIDDLVQEARIAVWEARRTHDPARAKFTTYARAALTYAMLDYVSWREKVVSREVELDEEARSEIATSDQHAVTIVLDLLRRTKDGYLLLAHALGVPNSSFGSSASIRQRRSRARERLRPLAQVA